ncbi:hypothetical protein ACFSL6_20140 [Paenibacillus thailandensis]|uniref:DNA/RNA helicase n=1 Tax=Paenibacillus thailandensis TaxID=393250 RepID=A0ABW5QVH5_9BACL
MPTDTKALLFNFADSKSAAIACDTLQELGYDPVLHEGNRVHIHLNGDDLTSALEIAQANGGVLAEQSNLSESLVVNTAYALDGLSIPAHIVNEDWLAEEENEAAGLRNRDEDADTDGEFLPDAGDYGYFSGDVKI